MKIKFYTEEFLYPRDIQNVLVMFGQNRNSKFEIINTKSSNRSSFLDLLVEIDGVMVGGLEITQSNDKDSRNAVYQRGQKFIQFKRYYPDARCVMYYNETFNVSSPTSKFGLGLLYNMGVELYNVEGDYPTNMNELIELKNSMKTKGTNTPVRIWIDEDKITLSCKLSKPSGWSDPNIGFVSTMCYLLKDYGLPIHIVNHQLTKKMTESRNKLFQNLCIINTNLTYEFEDGNVTWECDITKFTNSDTYHTIKEYGEKVSMIKFCKMLNKNPNVDIIFRNMAGCEREKMEFNGTKITIPKHMRIPDVVYLEGNDVKIVEGECQRNLKTGIKQLDTFDEFETLMKGFLNDCDVEVNTIKRGVITDKYVDSDNPLYWGYFLSSKDYKLSDEINL